MPAPDVDDERGCLSPDMSTGSQTVPSSPDQEDSAVVMEEVEEEAGGDLVDLLVVSGDQTTEDLFSLDVVKETAGDASLSDVQSLDAETPCSERVDPGPLGS